MEDVFKMVVGRKLITLANSIPRVIFLALQYVTNFVASVVFKLRTCLVSFLVQIVFFKGVALDVRSNVWPLLLGLVEYRDTAEVRKERKKERSVTFSQLTAKRYVAWHRK